MSERKGGRRRKHPKNTEWRGDVLFGRKRIKGVLRRWTLRTGDAELAAARVKEDIARLMASAFYGDHRVRYRDIVSSWAETHIIHEVGPNAAKRYAVSLRQLEPFLLEAFIDEVDKTKIDEIVTARRAAGVSTSTIRNDLTALSSVLKFADVDNNAAMVRLQKLKARREPLVLPDAVHIERMIARAPGRMADIIFAAWRTGCRLEELVTAQRSKLDHSRRQLTVIGKGNKQRTIDLDYGGAYERLRTIPARLGCRWLFWHGEGEPYRNLSSRFAGLVLGELAAAQRAAEEAGHQEPDFRKFRFHDLRHRHAVDWLKSGRSIYDLQQRLGHESVKTTEVYLRGGFLTPDERRVVMYGPQPAPQLSAEVLTLPPRGL